MSQINVDNIRNRLGGAIGAPSGIVVTGVSTFSGDVSIGGTLRSNINIENATPTLNLIDTDGSTTASFLGNSGNIFYSTSSSNRDHIFRGSTTEVVRINGDGNVGIATASPDNQLHVFGATTSAIKIETGDGVSILF